MRFCIGDTVRYVKESVYLNRGYRVKGDIYIITELLSEPYYRAKSLMPDGPRKEAVYHKSELELVV